MQKRILLVDDESALRRSLSLGLNQNGYDVEPCENGLTALDKLDLYSKSHMNLDVVVLDIQLPDINGKKLGRIIRSKYPDATMLYITGYVDKLDLLEIEDLKVDGLLEKPFTADVLSKQLDQILNKKPLTEETKEKEKAEPVTTSAYILIKIKQNADFFSLYKKLYFMENVLYCDATRGDIDIFMLIQSDSSEACRDLFENGIKNLDEIEEATFLPVDVPVLNDNIKDIISSVGITMFDDLPEMSKVRDSRKSVCSYVLVDVDRERLQEIYPVLRLTENVLYCDYISGKYNLVLMVHGPQFSEIDKIITNKIVNLGGVLKVKEYPIINIFEM
ncbi:MAG: response regulator [Ignavibacteriales bacterium]|nr:MAG: response regulator [Ignavibacteriales bacterium]